VWRKETVTDEFLAEEDVDESVPGEKRALTCRPPRDVSCAVKMPVRNACAAPQGGCAVDAHFWAEECQCLIFCAERPSRRESVGRGGRHRTGRRTRYRRERGSAEG
jgi:hypothetical protein